MAKGRRSKKRSSPKPTKKKGVVRKQTGARNRPRKPVGKSAKPSQRKRGRTTLSSMVRRSLRGNKTPRNTGIEFTDVGTEHRTYQVDGTKAGMKRFGKRFDKGAKANLVILYEDTDGNLQWRKTENRFIGEADDLYKSFDRMLNQYNTAKDVARVISVEVDVWNDKGNVLGNRPVDSNDKPTRSKSAKRKSNRNRSRVANKRMSKRGNRGKRKK